MKTFSCAILILLTFATPAFATVTISQPANGATSGSPVHFVATATASGCSKGVSSTGVYVNNQLKYIHTGKSLDTTVSLAPGSYNAVIEEWDKCGGAGTTARSIKVTGQTGVFVTFPANNSTVDTPANFVATATTSTCAQGVSSMGIYVDNALKYKVSGAKLNTQLAMSDGGHHAVVEEWDHCGGASTAPVNVTVENAGSDAPAFASVNISSPSSGEHVSSPFTLSASASNCSSQAVRTLGYSIDSGDTTMVQKSSNWSTASMDVKVSASEGTHTVHVMTWGQQGATCASDVKIDVTNVTDDVSSDTSIVPSNALSNSSLQKLGNWSAVHDTGTSGSSTGSMSLVGSPAHSGSSRKFTTTYKNQGGERYSVTFGDDRTHQNFLWDGWVYLTSTSSKIASLEMDLDQTMTNGQTVVFGFQCSGNSGTWDYSVNKGSASKPKGAWVQSKAACNPRSWKINVWHHVQISYSRTSGGNITYKSVYLDGAEKVLNAKVFGARSLGWGSGLTINFQVDGQGSSGSSTVYLSDLTLKRW